MLQPQLTEGPTHSMAIQEYCPMTKGKCLCNMQGITPSGSISCEKAGQLNKPRTLWMPRSMGLKHVHWLEHLDQLVKSGMANPGSILSASQLSSSIGWTLHAPEPSVWPLH